MKRNVRTALGLILFSGLIALGNPGKATPVEAPESNELSSPHLVTKGERILLNLFNSDGDRVVIWVTDSENRILFRQVIKDTMVIEKAFNFANAAQGQYTVKVRTDNRAFEERILVK